MKWMPCILISSREQQEAEQEYYQNTLGFGSGRTTRLEETQEDQRSS